MCVCSELYKLSSVKSCGVVIFYDDRNNLSDALMLCQPVMNWPAWSLPHGPKPAGYG